MHMYVQVRKYTYMYMYVLQLHNLAYPGEHEEVTPAVIRPTVIDTPNWPPLHCCRNPLLICAYDCHSYYFLKLVSTGLV